MQGGVREYSCDFELGAARIDGENARGLLELSGVARGSTLISDSEEDYSKDESESEE